MLQFEAGNIGLLNRGETHEDLDLGEQRDYLMVGVKGTFFGELLQGIGSRIDELPHFSVARLDGDSHIQRICEDLRSEYEGRELGRDFVLTSLVTELAIYVVRLFTSLPDDSAKASDIQGLRWQVRKALEYLQDTFTDDFVLERVSAAADLSKYHLDRVFKKATGVRPHTYVAILRVERAKELLTHTSTPIVDIALDLGFADQSHFSNVFKQFAGVSPRAYRESAKGNSKQQ